MLSSRYARLRAFATVAGLALGLSASAALAGDTTIGLSAAPGSARVGQAVTLTATVDGSAPTGAVTFRDGGKKLGTAALDAAAGAIAAGNYHTCTLTGEGAVLCWGWNAYGQLGDGSTTGSDVPVAVSGLDGSATKIAAIAAGSDHTCAVTGDAAVLCWGWNFSGQLGNADATHTDSYVPVAVSGLDGSATKIAAVSAGSSHTCAATDAGAVLCWGWNFSGQLGDGSTTDSDVPVAVSGLDGSATKIVTIAAGAGYTCAVTDQGAVLCWGYNLNGELGNGSTTDSDVPVVVSGLDGSTTKIVTIAAGDYHTCAVTDRGAVLCWGGNPNGELGDGNESTGSTVPVAVSGLDGSATKIATIAAGAFHTCAATDAGAALCWGDNRFGQLGDGSTTDSNVPVAVSGLDGTDDTVVSLAAGRLHTCALTHAGAGLCWGDNSDGQLGNGDLGADATTPVAVEGLTPVTSAKAAFEIAGLTAGTHTLRAAYAGDDFNAASTSAALSLKILPGKSKIKTVKITPKKPKAGKVARAKVTLKAVSPAKGNPEGKIVVKDGKKKLGAFKVKNGKAGFKLGKLSKGKHALKLTFKGDRNWGNSAAKKTVKVK